MSAGDTYGPCPRCGVNVDPWVHDCPVSAEPIHVTVGNDHLSFPVTIDPDGTIRDEHGRDVGHATPEALAALTDGAHLAVSIEADVHPPDPGLSL